MVVQAFCGNIGGSEKLTGYYWDGILNGAAAGLSGPGLHDSTQADHKITISNAGAAMFLRFASVGHDASSDLRPGLLHRTATLILATVTVILSISAAQHAFCAEKRSVPNVVIILTDDQGFGDLGYHGNPQVKTPNLDAFAREAVELAQFHVSPVCSPTRASLMTGRYNFRTGVCDVWGRAATWTPRRSRWRRRCGPPAMPPACSANGTWATSPSISPERRTASTRPLPSPAALAAGAILRPRIAP